MPEYPAKNVVSASLLTLLTAAILGWSTVSKYPSNPGEPPATRGNQSGVKSTNRAPESFKPSATSSFDVFELSHHCVQPSSATGLIVAGTAWTIFGLH